MPIYRQHFDSVHGLLELWDSVKINARWGYQHYLSGGEEGAEILRIGTEQYNADIEQYSKSIWDNIPVMRREWSMSFAGAFPNVPAYLAGEPMDMWHLQETASDRSPIRIWVGTTSSGAVSEKQLIERGAALCTFAQALSEIRPVQLTPYTAFGEGRNHDTDTILSWDITTSPLILSAAAASLCEPRVTRYMMLHFAYMLQPLYMGAWAYKYNDEKEMREILGAQDDDLWLGSIHVYDELLTDPIAWVKRHIAKFLDEDTDEPVRTFR